MKRGNKHFWRLAVRTIFAPVFAYLLVIQSILLPVARAKTIELAGQDAALSIICSTSLAVPGEDGSDPTKKHVHDLGCCTLAARLMLDVPVALIVAVVPIEAPQSTTQGVEYILPQSRAPPAITATPSQSRAPPSLI